MGYYIRILGIDDPNIHLDELIKAVEAGGLVGNFNLAQNESPDNWSILEVANTKGEVLTQIERNPVIDGGLGKEELEEFRANIRECKPESAVKWLNEYFDKVKVIYAFQLLDNAFEDSNYPILAAVKEKIWNRTGGIFQADGEGFSNDDGYHILWQFSDKITGDWHCAVLNDSNEWERFQMDLGDKGQRQEFQAGRVPAGAVRI